MWKLDTHAGDEFIFSNEGEAALQLRDPAKHRQCAWRRG